MTTYKTRTAYRVIDNKGKSLFGFMHDEQGYWTTNFESHKWKKVSKKHFHEDLSIKLNSINILVVNDPSVIRF